MQFNEQRGIYQQIADHLCENILTGGLAPGDRVASVRDMAEQIAVNPNTVVRSYTLLLDREILINRRGIGYFVADDAPLKVKAMWRERFIRDELPAVFRTMALLGMDIEDLREIHHQFNERI